MLLNHIQKVRLPQVVVSRLEELMVARIAHDLNVKPEEVTPEFIRHWREEHLYPDARIDLTTLYGGYNHGGRRVLTSTQLKTCREEAERFIDQF
jgi:hypothetical protein